MDDSVTLGRQSTITRRRSCIRLGLAFREVRVIERCDRGRRSPALGASEIISISILYIQVHAPEPISSDFFPPRLLPLVSEKVGLQAIEYSTGSGLVSYSCNHGRRQQTCSSRGSPSCLFFVNVWLVCHRHNARVRCGIPAAGHLV